MESIETLANAKEQLKLDILHELEVQREEVKTSILKEVEETVSGSGAVHQAYVKAVEFVFEFTQKRITELSFQLEGDFAEIEEATKNRFETIQETEVSLEEAFDFGYKTASIEIRNLQTL